MLLQDLQDEERLANEEDVNYYFYYHTTTDDKATQQWPSIPANGFGRPGQNTVITLTQENHGRLRV